MFSLWEALICETFCIGCAMRRLCKNDRNFLHCSAASCSKQFIISNHFLLPPKYSVLMPYTIILCVLLPFPTIMQSYKP